MIWKSGFKGRQLPPLNQASCSLCLRTHRFCGCSWLQWWESRSWWPGWCLWSRSRDPSALYTPTPTLCLPWSCVLCCHAETRTCFILSYEKHLELHENVCCTVMLNLWQISQTWECEYHEKLKQSEVPQLPVWHIMKVGFCKISHP